IPAHRQIRSLLRLDAMHGVEHHHALFHDGCVLLQSSTLGSAPPDLERHWFAHRVRLPALTASLLIRQSRSDAKSLRKSEPRPTAYFISLITAFNSSGIGASSRFSTRISP